MTLYITRLAAVCVLSLALVNLGGVGFAHAGIITTEGLLPSTRTTDLAAVRATLDRKDVTLQLETFGVARAAAEARIANLTDQELHRLARDLQNAPAGGDSLLALIGAVFVVLMILELMGVIDIFKKT
jgi:ribosomal protein S13